MMMIVLSIVPSALLSLSFLFYLEVTKNWATTFFILSLGFQATLGFGSVVG